MRGGAVIALVALMLTPAQACETLHGLTVAAEDRCSPYNSRDYRPPPSVEPRIVDRQGGIFSPYTGETFDSIRQTDIEHIVAKSEAHDSGLCAAEVAERRAFSRDLDNLTLASPRLNQHQKRAKDAAEWMPARNRCWFARQVIIVKARYDLTVDEAEAEALNSALAECAVR